MATTTIREIEIRFTGKGRRVAERLRTAEDAARFFVKLIAHDARELYVALYLDARNQPIGWRIVSMGTATASLVHPRETFQPAIMLGAVSVILAHNHPSGDPDPSAEDRDVTRRLARAGQILGVTVLDHFVIGAAGRWRSVRELHPALFALILD